MAQLPRAGGRLGGVQGWGPPTTLSDSVPRLEAQGDKQGMIVLV